jgi:hypothetical protein
VLGIVGLTFGLAMLIGLGPSASGAPACDTTFSDSNADQDFGSPISDLRVVCLDDGQLFAVQPVVVFDSIDSSGPGQAGMMVLIVMLAMIGITLATTQAPASEPAAR